MSDTHSNLTSECSESTITMPKPIFYICIVAVITHTFFWLQLIAYKIGNHRSMQWLYCFLIVDFLLLIRFFVLYSYRWRSICLASLAQTIMCYLEAVSDNYLNVPQSYNILALNACRYLQIVTNHKVYDTHPRAIITVHILIYILPALGYTIQIISGWAVLYHVQNEPCDILILSRIGQILYLIFAYFVPVLLTLFFLLLSLKRIRNTMGLRTQQMIDARLKYHRQLVKQLSVFYTIWLLLWSPGVLVFPFIYTDSGVGNTTQLLGLVCIALDPITLTLLDVRFLRAWRSTWDRLKRLIRQHRVVPIH